MDIFKLGDKIKSSDPNSPEMLLIEGEMHFNIGNIKMAEEIFLDILRTHPNHLGALNNLACIRIVETKWDEALDLLNKVLTVDSSCKDALENMKFLEETRKVYLADDKAEDAGVG